MKINLLHIYNYKNLNFELENKSSIIALIGNNGSGKSNILEAISTIFFHLYNKKEKDIPFNFKIEYVIGGNQKVLIEKNHSTTKFIVDEKPQIDIQQLLPKQIVAIYSGEENRLWLKSYQPLYNAFISSINKSETTGLGEYALTPKMLYINKFYWHISLLCLLLSEAPDTISFCEQILGIDNVNSIKFDFNKPNYSNYSDSAVKTFITLIDKKSEYSLVELRKIIFDNHYSLDLVYKYLYIAFTPDRKKMLDNIIIKYNEENLDIEDFSEGEKKMLLIKAGLEFAGLEDSLFLLDEPDAHIHLSNKIQIKNVFNEYLTTRQIILSTHSPTLTDLLDDESLFMLNSGKLVHHRKQEILENVAGEFWNKFQQNSFIATKKSIILLLEGKHDKEHITHAFEALKNDYKKIDFQCFVLNSESKIQPFLSGLYESDFYSDKLYIGIYDNDKAVEKSFGSFEKVNENFKKLKENNGKINNSYFAIKLPKPSGVTCDCTIETLYELDKFEEAIKTATNNALGHLKNKSIDEIAKGIKEQAKNILCENAKTFFVEDFKNFRALFDLIVEIQTHRNNLLSHSEEKEKKVSVIKSDGILNVENLNDEEKQTKKTTNPEYVTIFTNRRGSKVKAHFYPKSQNVIIQPNSIISKSIVISFSNTEKLNRKKLIAKHCLTKDNIIVVNSPIEFSSPSGAIKFSVGSNLNGWDYWLIEDSNAPLKTIRFK